MSSYFVSLLYLEWFFYVTLILQSIVSCFEEGPIFEFFRSLSKDDIDETVFSFNCICLIMLHLSKMRLLFGTLVNFLSKATH